MKRLLTFKPVLFSSLSALLIFCAFSTHATAAEEEFENVYENADALVQWNTSASKPSVIRQEQFHATLDLFSLIKNIPGGSYKVMIELVNKLPTKMTVSYDVIAQKDQNEGEILLGSYEITKSLPTLKKGARLDFPDEKVPTEGYLSFPQNAEFGTYTLYARFTNIEAKATFLHKDITGLVEDYLPPETFEPGIKLAEIELTRTPPAGTIRPEVIAVSPNDQTDVPVDTIIEVTFNEPVDSLSAQDAFSITPETPGEFGYSEKVLTFTPTKKLSRNTEYQITIGTGVRDLTGTPLATEFSTSFTTQPNPSRMWILYTIAVTAVIALISYLIIRLIRRRRRRKPAQLEA